MSIAVSETIEQRRAQAFPVLATEELARLHRFGRPRRFMNGERVFETGRISPGIYVVLSGKIRIAGRCVGDQPGAARRAQSSEGISEAAH